MKPRTWILIAIAVVAAGFGAWGMLRGPIVHVVRVERTSLVQTVVVSGRVAAPAHVSIGSVAIGRVVEVKAREGDRVVAGELLIRLEEKEAMASVQQANASLAKADARVDQVLRVTGRVASEDLRQAKSALELADRRFVRISGLAASGSSTVDDLDQARSQRDQAQARQAAAESQAWGSASLSGTESRAARAEKEIARANLAAAEARLEQTRILAPANGILLARNVEVGDVVQPWSVLMAMATEGIPYLVVQPDEKNLYLLREGQEAIASSDAFPGLTFPAKVSRILPAVDRLRGTIEVRLTLNDPPAYLRPDMTVSVEMMAEKREATITLPEVAVRESGGRQPWVLVAREGRVQRRDVRLGMRGEDRFEVVEGLAQNEDVVVSDGVRLRPGQRVTVVRE